MIDPAIEPERRGAARYPSGPLAIIGLPTGDTVRCSIRNVSTEGARIRLEAVTELPNAFLLWIQGDWPRRCQVMWTRDEEMGVAFVEDAPIEEATEAAPSAQ